MGLRKELGWGYYLAKTMGLDLSQYEVGGGQGNVRQFGKYGWYQGLCMNIEPYSNFVTFFDSIPQAIKRTVVTTWAQSNHKLTGKHGTEEKDGCTWKIEKVLTKLRHQFLDVHAKGGRLFFIGNGGSAAIASHMAIDYSKNARIRACTFNDVPTITCLANDYGYEHCFVKQLGYQASRNDAVVIISSSGMSPSVVNAGKHCRKNELRLVTFTGMNPNNELRHMGDLNFWVPSMDYGIVELTHSILLHAVASVMTQHERDVIMDRGLAALKKKRRKK